MGEEERRKSIDNVQETRKISPLESCKNIEVKIRYLGKNVNTAKEKCCEISC